jgi:rhomboid protease GluP
MPKYEQHLSVESDSPFHLLAVCYSTFQQLGWAIKYATEDQLLAHTPASTFSKSIQVTVRVVQSELIVSSEMINDEMMDINGKNKKNVQNFLDSYERVSRSITTKEIEANKEIIEQLKIDTVAAAEQEAQELAELNEALNLSKGNLLVTYSIIGINIVVFILMALQGAGIIDANGLVHIKWGSNFGPLTLSGDWWRLFTAVFLHFGVIHLGLNMYALFSIGTYLEPMLGKFRYITAYVCTGILASLVSLWWHTEPANSAGASGAVFGMYGVFLALLTTNLIPKKVRQPLLQSIVIFVIYNLVYGLKGGIDNAAHIGGLLSGILIGYLFSYSIRKEKKAQPVSWIIPVTIASSLAVCAGYLQQNRASKELRSSVLAELSDAGYSDVDRFNELYNQFIALQDEALQVYNEYGDSATALAGQLQEKALPKWEQAHNIAEKLMKLNVSPSMLAKANTVSSYIQLRKMEAELEIKMINDPDKIEAYSKQQEIVRQRIETEVAKLK